MGQFLPRNDAFYPKLLPRNETQFTPNSYPGIDPASEESTRRLGESSVALGEHDPDGVLSAMRSDPRTSAWVKPPGGAQVVFGTALALPATKAPAPRRPLYREDNTLETSSIRPKSAPLKIRSFAWLNPSGEVFEQQNRPLVPNPSFQVQDTTEPEPVTT